MTVNTPKTLLSFSDGTTILEKQIENAIDAGIDSICIVTGFKPEQIEAKIRHWQYDIPISTIFSAVFKTTNSLVSAWMARSHMTEDFMITDSDNVYRVGILRDVINEAPDDSIHLIVSPKPFYDSEDMGVKISGDRVLCMSKQFPLDQVNTNCVGLAIIRGQRNQQLFANSLDGLFDNRYNDYWEEALNSLIDNGVHVGYISIDDNDWIEVDTVGDYEKAKAVFSRTTSREPENGSANIGGNQSV